MLLPASLRVCCLAGMAPALTKADRQADCLPVVLEPLCVSKTTNSEGRINGFTVSKILRKSACLPNRRKIRMLRAWWRTPLRACSRFPFKSQISSSEIKKSYLSESQVRINAEIKIKSWHGTNATTAIADKVKLKYTMSKNNGSFKNMGLAKANTTLGLQSWKRMNRITQFSPAGKSNPSSILRDGDSLPDLPDSTNSELQFALEVTNHDQPAEIATDGVSSSDADVPFSASNNPIVLPHIENDVSRSSTTDYSLLPVPLVSDCNVPTSSSYSEVGGSSPASGECINQVSSDFLTESRCSSEILVTTKTPIASQEKAGLSSPASCSVSSCLTPCDVPALNNVTDCTTLSTEPSSKIAVTSEVVTVCSSSESSNAESTSLQHPVFDLPFSTESTASTTPLSSEFASILPSTSQETEGKEELLMSLSVPVLTLLSKRETSSDLSTVLRFTKSAFSFREASMRSADATSRQICCPFSELELDSGTESLTEKERGSKLAIERSNFVLRKHTSAHVKKQMKNLVEYYQKKLTIPCQQQVQTSNIVTGKDLSDFKAELLQKEDVKSLSTAALVNLVRKLESSGSPGNLLSQQKSCPESGETSNEITATLDLEEFPDIKHTRSVLARSMRNILKSVDPDLTESSDEEYASETEDTEPSDQKRALWRYVTDRAALARNSTWVVSRIHEMENQLRTFNGVYQKVCECEGSIRFEEQVVSNSSALPSAGSSNASLQTTALRKQSEVKSFTKPLNGYLDHDPVSNTTQLVQTSDSCTVLSLTDKELETSTFSETDSCSRTRALNTAAFHKRKLLATTGLHLTESKFARLSTVGCDCNSQDVMHPCVLCTGRYNCVQSVDPDSMSLPDRIALLDPTFHPLLTFEKDITLALHMESILKKKESQYQSFCPVIPITNHRRLFGAKPKRFVDMRSHNRKLNRYARSLLSAKYRKKLVRNTKHLRKHGLVFGKWRRFHPKSSFSARDRIRRMSVSSDSRDSPVPSPSSVFDEGYDQMKRRHGYKFGIDDFINPYNSKSGRSVNIEYKEIEIPSWRYKETCVDSEMKEESEELSETALSAMHEKLQMEERKKLRSGVIGSETTLLKRARRQHRSDSRADSSGANTPDPVLMCNQDIMFQVPSTMENDGPSSLAVSPPTTPSSAVAISDDSQPSLGNGPLTNFEKRKFIPRKPFEESFSYNPASDDYEAVPPYDRLSYPLSDKVYEERIAEDEPLREEFDVLPSVPSYPASPESSTSSTSTVDEDDITDPEWTVVKRDTGPDLVLKLAKR